jgi:hypothetical protein
MTRRVSSIAVKLITLAAAFAVCLGFWASIAASVRRLIA